MWPGSRWFERGTGEAEIHGGSCVGADWRVAPLRVGPQGNPPLFLSGRARSDIAHIRLRYADGDTEGIEPGQFGYVLQALPAEHRAAGSELVELVGLDERGEVVDRIKLQPMQR